MRTYSHVQDLMASHLSLYISEVCSQSHLLQPFLCVYAGTFTWRNDEKSNGVSDHDDSPTVKLTSIYFFF